MGEQATRIADQRSGDYIATRDAYENDGDGKARTIQIMDFGSRQIPSPSLIRSGVSTVDSVDMASLPVQLTDNLITVGDRALLVVFIQHSVNDGEVTITPIIFNDAEQAIGIRAAKASAMGTSKFVKSGSYHSPQLTWDTQGAEKIGLHISVIDGAGNSVALSAGVI